MILSFDVLGADSVPIKQEKTCFGAIKLLYKFLPSNHINYSFERIPLAIEFALMLFPFRETENKQKNWRVVSIVAIKQKEYKGR